MKVKIDPKTYKTSKVAPTVIARIQAKLESDPLIDPPRAKKKWFPTVDLNGDRYAVSCHEKDGFTEVTNVRKARQMKGQPWKK